MLEKQTIYMDEPNCSMCHWFDQFTKEDKAEIMTTMDGGCRLHEYYVHLYDVCTSWTAKETLDERTN